MRDEILAAIDDVTFYPSWGKKRLHNMIRDRGDWVISRQRVWGVPLPIFYGEDGEAIITPETIEHVAQLFEKYGSDVWFDREAKDLLPDGFTSPHSPNGQFTKETDIMDVWFDSGSSHQGVLVERPELEYPADMYLEGSDQYRGWFNSSLITSVAVSGHAPYKSVVSQGFTLDGEGHKMSKSLGNTIAPAEVIKQMGAEIVRLWVASVDSSADVRVSIEAFTKISDSYKKIRNTMRYMLANTSDFDPKTNAVPVDDLASADKYMLAQFNQFVESVKGHYDQYDFLDIYKELMNFVISDLSAFYLDFAKDILYIDAQDSHSRRSMQTVLYTIAVGLTKLLTPILPHTTEEIWPFLKETEDYVQLAEMPAAEHFEGEAQLVANWDAFMAMRSDVLKSLEEARDQKLIGKASEAKLGLYLDDKHDELLNSLNTDVRQVLMVSGLATASLNDAPAEAENYNDGVAVTVAKADGEVCDRCRMTREDVGEDSAYPHFCGRCAKIVRENFPETVDSEFEDYEA